MKTKLILIFFALMLSCGTITADSNNSYFYINNYTYFKIATADGPVYLKAYGNQNASCLSKGEYIESSESEYRNAIQDGYILPTQILSNDKDLLAFLEKGGLSAPKNLKIVKQIVKSENIEVNSGNQSNQKSEQNNVSKPQLDEKTIIAKLKYRENLKSNCGLKAGQIVPILKVEDSKDESYHGCEIYCQIMEIRKSNLNGDEGRLVIRPLYIQCKDNSIKHLLPTDIYRRGKNRANVKQWLTPLTAGVLIFIAGSGAQITPVEEFSLRLE